MSRRLFAVALLPSAPLVTHVDGVRAALDDPRRGDLPTHLTLVPPIPLAEADVDRVRGALRRAATPSEPFELRLGPAATFAPRTSTLHLEVHGELERLHELRTALRVPPLDRPDDHDFVPHVTLLQRATPGQVDAGLALLRAPLGSWQVTSVHLLERLRPDTESVWHPVAEEPLGGPRVVGRGGVELHLRATSVVEPGVAALAGPVGEAPLPSGGVTLVAIAELPGRPGHAVGAAWGRADATGAVLDMTVVDPAHRGQGIGRQVVGEWCRAAVDRGAGVVAARPLDLPGTAEGVAGGGPEAFLSALGFGAVDATTWCRRVGPLGELGSLP